MKKIIRASILSLALALAFMFTAVLAEGAPAGRFFSSTAGNHFYTHGLPTQAMHNIDKKYDGYLDLNKHEITLKKGQTTTIKAFINPNGKSLTVKWTSSNPKIAKISSAGKITAVAAGIAVIRAESEEYYGIGSQYGYSDECYVYVPAGAKDPKLLEASDRVYFYGKTKFTVPTGNFGKALVNVQKSIGGYEYYLDEESITGLLFGSKNINTAHTNIYILGTKNDSYGYGFVAKGGSPVKTNRGIAIGTKKSTVQQKYGLPIYISQYTEEGKSYEAYTYVSKPGEEDLCPIMAFEFLKSKGAVTEISLFIGGYNVDDE